MVCLLSKPWGAPIWRLTMANNAYELAEVLVQEGGEASLPIVLSNDFDEMIKRLISAQQIHKASEVLVQVYASWITHNALWIEAKEVGYRDLHTGVEYSEIGDAPEARRPYLAYYSTRHYRTRGEFLRDLEKRVPFFNVGTFLARHDIIIREIGLWATGNKIAAIPEELFIKACENVLLNGMRFVDEMTSAFFVFQANKGLSLRPDAPLAAIGVDKDSDDVTARTAMALHEIIVDAHGQISSGVSRTKVGRGLRRRILGKGTVTAYVGDNKRIGVYYKPSEIQYGQDWVIEPAKRYHVRIFDTDGKEVFIDGIDKDISEWLYRSLKLSTGTSRYNKRSGT